MRVKGLFLLSILSLAIIIMSQMMSSCANPGSGPDGGAYDETPPKIISMSPKLGKRHANPRKIEIIFDENIKLDNPQEKVTVSPAQVDPPEISSSGKRITVTLHDTLKPNTTYTIDFGEAISDNNEGNPFGNFTYYFSTGDALDTMEIAGTVVDAQTLAPVKGVLVGLYNEDDDSAFQTRPFDRVARTSEDGKFSIKGVRNGSYKLYALKDVDGDLMFSSRSEIMGFTDKTYQTSSFPDIRYDTIWRDTVYYDSIKVVHYTHYTPDDVVILAFQHADKPRHFLKKQRDVPEWFRMYFTGPSGHRPEITGLNFDANDRFVEISSPFNDTITYWLKDSALLKQDTLAFAYSYMETDDSTGMDTLRTDTFELVPRMTMARKLKERAEEMKRFEKEREKRHKRGDYSQETLPAEFIELIVKVQGNLPPNENIPISIKQPFARFDESRVHLYLGPDTARTEAPFRLDRHETDPMLYVLRGEWNYEQQYTLVIDSAAAENIYGLVNRKVEKRFKISKQEEFGSVFVTLPDADSSAIVQLMQDDKRVVRQEHYSEGSADFFYVKPGKYYLRMFIDDDGDDLWTPGDYSERRQPERMYYYNKQVDVRANWDTEITWNAKSIPILQQKPEGLRKNTSSKSRQTAHQRNLERRKEKRK